MWGPGGAHDTARIHAAKVKLSDFLATQDGSGVPAERDIPGHKQVLPHGGSIECFNYDQKGDSWLSHRHSDSQ